MSNQKVLKSSSSEDSAARIAITSRAGTKMKPISTMIYVFKPIKMIRLALLMMITQIMQTQVNKRISDHHNYLPQLSTFKLLNMFYVCLKQLVE